MKRFFAFIMTVLTVSSVFMNTSCILLAFIEPDSPEALWENIEEEMDSLESYEADYESEIVFYIDGIKIEGESTGRGIESGVHTEDEYYYFGTQNIEFTSPELGIDTKNSSIEAYNEGMIFLSNQGDSADQRICGYVTKDEFYEYMGDTSVNELYLTDCVNKAFERNDESLWELTCSGYTKQAVGALSEDMGLGDMELGGEITDVEISVTADKNYRVKQIFMQCVFDADDETQTPVFSTTVNYSRYNEARKVLSRILPENYTEKRISEC